MHRLVIAASLFLSLSLGVGRTPAALYSDDFDVNSSASWTVNATTANNVAGFAFDYGTLGIPSAPNSVGGTTKGLKLQSNVIGATAGYTGLSVSPTSQSFTGDYELHADVWLNYQNPNGVPAPSGTTQYAGVGILTNGTTAQWAGTTAGFPAVTSLSFQATVDSGQSAATNADYRVVTPSGLAVTSPPYAASGTAIRDNTNTYYTTKFPSFTLPGTLTTGGATQTGPSLAGNTAFKWRDWAVIKAGNIVTWSIDGFTIASFDVTGAGVGTTSGTNILLNYSDSNAGQSVDSASASLLFGLFDNVRVSAIPEPGAFLLGGLVCGVFGLAAMKRRRSANSPERVTE